MKTRMYLIVVMFLFGASFLCAEELKVFSNEEIAGTWVNPNYTGFIYNLQKIIYYHWGYSEAYIYVNSDSPTNRGTYHLIDKWIDLDGNTLFKSIERYDAIMNYMYHFGKISNDKTVIEWAFSYISIPSEDDLNPDNANYRIYYRQE